MKPTTPAETQKNVENEIKTTFRSTPHYSL